MNDEEYAMDGDDVDFSAFSCVSRKRRIRRVCDFAVWEVGRPIFYFGLEPVARRNGGEFYYTCVSRRRRGSGILKNERTRVRKCSSMNGAPLAPMNVRPRAIRSDDWSKTLMKSSCLPSILLHLLRIFFARRRLRFQQRNVLNVISG